MFSCCRARDVPPCHRTFLLPPLRVVSVSVFLRLWPKTFELELDRHERGLQQTCWKGIILETKRNAAER